MKLKIKTYIILIFAFALSIQESNAQKTHVKLEGIVKYDSTYLQDINILNKATNLGTSSNENGLFTIYAKEGDSIMFSSVVYENRIIKISKTHLNSKTITVYLEPDYYQLDEVMLAKKVFINWRDTAVTKGTILNNDGISNRKAPNARKLTDPNANAGGINPFAIFTMLTKKGRIKRKIRRLEQEEIKQLKNEFPNTIKNLYGAIFFKEALHISEDNIYLFLDYCEGNGLNQFFERDEIVIKNFLILQAKKFNSIKN
ncbi:carboxypeptidase-like regulatory domain-containing protein [Lutibacter sp.]|uniref:carboxypeptidase-like regulatory domain-containing protein n=1 Tax=Lutibacter sp. TaxID=1925666 RepID=UPI003561AF60